MRPKEGLAPMARAVDEHRRKADKRT